MEKKIKGRKRHLVVDTLGLPLEVWVTAADVTDREVGCELLEHVKQQVSTLRTVWVDGAYTGLVEEVGREIGIRVDSAGSHPCLGDGSSSAVSAG